MNRVFLYSALLAPLAYLTGHAFAVLVWGVPMTVVAR